MNRANLITLAKYFAQHKKLKAKFNMSVYCEDGYFSSTNCGSIGCAVGHGPYAGISKSKDEKWLHYGQRVFDVNMAEFCFLFSYSWHSVDNTKAGLVRRINYFLKNGVPGSFNTAYNNSYILAKKEYNQPEFNEIPKE